MAAKPPARARHGSATPRRPATPKPAKRRSFLWRWRRGLFLIGLLFVASLTGTGFVLAQIELPPARPQVQTTFICTSEVVDDCNQDNATARLFGEQDRVDVALEQVPEVLVQAVLASEDRDYFDHAGVDPVGIARAAIADIRGSSQSTQGGSTITQQYVKTVYLTNERTIVRKVREAVLAIKLEQELSKEEILERYLNAIYFGRGTYGVGTAARTYFGHDISQIDLAEAAFLAGLIRRPESADPLRDPEEATRRRRTVLRGMVEEGYITQAEMDAADAEPWIEGDTIMPRPDREGLGAVRGEEYGTEYFIEHVRLELKERYGITDEQLYGGGLRVYTTLSHDAQRAAYEAVTGVLDDPATDPQAGLAAVDGSGAVRAMYGGRDFSTNEFNYATSSGSFGRQPGSSMKPFVLAAAIDSGISLESRFQADGRMEFEVPGPDWTVRNYGGTEQGVLDLLDATRVSSNTAYAQLMIEVGPQKVADLAMNMGISRQLDPVYALALGTEEVSPLDMASAYGTFANRGVRRETHTVVRVERADGSEYPLPPRAEEQVLSQSVADQVTYALREVVNEGTGTGARLPNSPAAGKTGTTQNNTDAWFVGYTPNALSAAVWMGYEPVDEDGDGDVDSRPMNDVRGRAVTGGSFPATIWRDFMTRWVDIAGGNPGRFPSSVAFSGEALNSDLTTTTSTIPSCAEGQESTEEAPCETTTTSESSSTTVDTSGSTTITLDGGATTVPSSVTTPPPSTGDTLLPTTDDTIIPP